LRPIGEQITSARLPDSNQGAALDVLTYYDFRPWLGPSQACKTVDLTIAGRRQDPLIGGDCLQAIGRMLGRSLT
jgi:hypothetical protein